MAVVAGNVFADFMRRVGAEPLDDDFRAGLALHRAMDAFTDRHPVVRGLRGYFSPSRRRLAGVLTDVAFDYCLVMEWSRYREESLEDYVAARLRPIRAYVASRGSPLVQIVDKAERGGWLLSYGSREGLHKTFARMASRHRLAASGLMGAEVEIVARADSFLAAFRIFYPELQVMASRFGGAA